MTTNNRGTTDVVGQSRKSLGNEEYVWEFIKSAVLSTLAGRVEGGTEKLRLDVWRRAGRLCECTMKTCSHHSTRCNASLVGDWELHRIDPGGLYIPSNVIAMCETCHRRNTPNAALAVRTGVRWLLRP